MFYVEVDGKKEEIESSILLIGLINLVGGFEILFLNVKVDDGKFYLVYLKDFFLIDMFKILLDLLKGVGELMKNLVYFICE